MSMPHSLLIFVLSLIFTHQAVSHGGGLNSEGCHNEKKTGGYHCHRATSYKTTSPKQSDTKSYDREDYNYRSYRATTSVGFYTGRTCKSINIDHIVSLKDAHESGAYGWSLEKKSAFGNDRYNHVPSCRKINSSKGSAGPREFLKRSQDGKGLDYQIIRFCQYVKRYHSVKIKYGLSFASNSKSVFSDCGIKI